MPKFEPVEMPVTTVDELSACLNAIECLEMGEGEQYQVTIKSATKSRSARQRRLQHMIHGDIAKHYGYQQHQVRNMMMKKFAIPIFYEDDINDSRATIDAIYAVKAIPGMYPYYQELIRDFARKITSNSFNTKQNAQYINQLEYWANERRIPIRIPDDMRELMRYEEENKR